MLLMCLNSQATSYLNSNNSLNVYEHIKHQKAECFCIFFLVFITKLRL